ncbi:imidazole glycerol phosphate synthase subunit HisH [Psychrobacillus glaciei]|uniref:Imidazole glycerol phosphate synthase subunit HisH n=1 Tax=Psychrobacillus glaciei TaxID=2283160 RepID=A0A5J6SLB0_9BACI|nr:imidazole glycerol phosphate synthase subunit HisH [Psychrobacillus glaciei]QFF98760.1 imidazole glycerol phosphate synthase subunit HisH [Psychrobacillus glaciei]
MIGIIDYGAGNLHSVLKAIARLGYETKLITKSTDHDESITKLILPGVGNAKVAMDVLNESGLSDYLRDQVAKGTSLLGICLGMQLLLESSEEGNVDCLGFLRGTVPEFKEYSEKIPHMGWNQVNDVQRHFLFNDIPDNTDFYFVHSYFAKTRDEKDVLGSTNYGIDFASAIGNQQVMGVQFHPEKSGKYGIQLLENYCK